MDTLPETQQAPAAPLEPAAVRALLGKRDWSTSPLGPPDAWPDALRTVASLMLDSKFPMFVAWGPELGFLYNDAYAEILGEKHPAALGARFYDIWSEIWADIEPLIQAALRGESVFREDLPLVVSRKGYDEEAWFTFSYSPVRDDAGQVAGMFCAVSETTGKVIGARALQESEARFRNMADHSPVMMWVTEPDGRCSYLNRPWYAFTGQTEAEALGHGWLDATHPDDRPVTARAFAEANALRQPFRVEYRLRRADGSYRWAIDAAAPRFSENGDFLGYVGSVIDIQEDWEVRAKVRDSEARLQILMNAMPAFVWLASPDGELTYFNDRWYALTGQPRETALPNGWARTLHPDDADRTARRWAKALETGRPYEIEMRYRMKGGAYRWYVARAEPVRDGLGQVTAWMGVSFDIHENRLAAEHQNLLINELNHRVKNTLATVQAMAAQSLRAPISPREAHEVFVGRLMALSDAHNVLTEHRWTGADIDQVVARAVHTFASGPIARFRTEGPPARLSAKAALALAMALHELGTNASKYGALSTSDGWVELSWTAATDQLELTWREHGGPPVGPPSRRGFGTRLLERGLAAELNGSVELEFAPDGLICRIRAPSETAFG